MKLKIAKKRWNRHLKRMLRGVRWRNRVGDQVSAPPSEIERNKKAGESWRAVPIDLKIQVFELNLQKRNRLIKL